MVLVCRFSGNECFGIKRSLQFFEWFLLALNFADDSSLFGILHPTTQSELVAYIFAVLGEVAAWCSSWSSVSSAPTPDVPGGTRTENERIVYHHPRYNQTSRSPLRVSSPSFLAVKMEIKSQLGKRFWRCEQKHGKTFGQWAATRIARVALLRGPFYSIKRKHSTTCGVHLYLLRLPMRTWKKCKRMLLRKNSHVPWTWPKTSNSTDMKAAELALAGIRLRALSLAATSSSCPMLMCKIRYSADGQSPQAHECKWPKNKTARC